MLNILIILAVLFTLPLLGFLFGAFSGWVVGLFFGHIVLGFFSQIGLDGFTMWEIGGILGFVSGYFKTWMK